MVKIMRKEEVLQSQLKGAHNMYSEKIAYLYIENEANDKAAISTIPITQDQSSIQLTIHWLFFNLRKDKSYFTQITINRDGNEKVLNQPMVQVDNSQATNKGLNSLGVYFSPKISNPQSGTYQISVLLLDSDHEILDSCKSYFQLVTEDGGENA